MKLSLWPAILASMVLLFQGPGIANAETIVGQVVTNDAAVTTGDPALAASITGVGDIGTGASVSITSSGASAVSSLSGINADFTAPAGGYGTVTQDSTNSGAVSTYGEMLILGATTAAGATASLGATGASAAFSVTGNNTDGSALALPQVGPVSQTVTNADTGTVYGFGTILFTNVVSGDGASVSMSASGAVTVVATTGINAASFGGGLFSTIAQNPANAAAVFLYGAVDVGSLTGNGTSVSISARGASASITATTIGNADLAGTAGSSYGAVTQNATNSGVVEVFQSELTIAGALTGIGSSASISASGATTSFAVASIADTEIPTATTVTSIVQSSANTANVANGSLITLAGALGTGASASISATGAGTFASFTTIGTP